MVEGYRVQSMVAILPSIPSILLPSGSEYIQVNTPDRSIPGAPDALSNRQRSDIALLIESVNQNEDKVDQLLIADSLHRIRLFRFGLLGSLSSNSNVSAARDITNISSTTTETNITLVSTDTTSLVQSRPTASQSDTTTSSSTSSALAVYMTSAGVPGGPTSISISTSSSSASTEVPISLASNNSTASDNPAVAAALAVARLAQQQQERLSQTNVIVSSTVSAGNWYQQPYPTSTANVSAYTSSPSILPRKFIFF